MKIFAEALLPSSGPLLKIQAAVAVQPSKRGYDVCLIASLASDPSIVIQPPIRMSCTTAEAADTKLFMLDLLDKLAEVAGGLAWVDNRQNQTSKLVNGVATAKPKETLDGIDVVKLLVSSWHLAVGSERIPHS